MRMWTGWDTWIRGDVGKTQAISAVPSKHFTDDFPWIDSGL